MPAPRNAAAAAAANGKIYVMGGDLGDGNNSSMYDSILEYDPVADTWTARGTFVKFSAGAAVSVNNRVYAIGGYDFVTYGLDKVTEYLPNIYFNIFVKD